jgi:hypothetical protein
MVARKILLQLAVQDIGQLTDFGRKMRQTATTSGG